MAAAHEINFDIDLYTGKKSGGVQKDERCEELCHQILREGSIFPFVANNSNLIDVYTILGEYANTETEGEPPSY